MWSNFYEATIVVYDLSSHLVLLIQIARSCVYPHFTEEEINPEMGREGAYALTLCKEPVPVILIF